MKKLLIASAVLVALAMPASAAPVEVQRGGLFDSSCGCTTQALIAYDGAETRVFKAGVDGLTDEIAFDKVASLAYVEAKLGVNAIAASNGGGGFFDANGNGIRDDGDESTGASW